MRNTFYALTLLALTLLTTPLFGQFAETEVENHWKLGVNLGAAYQTSQVDLKPGIGWGLTLGKTVYKPYASNWYIDVRARYLGALSYGFDTDTSLGFLQNPAIVANDSVDYLTAGSLRYFDNHETKLHELDLEAAISWTDNNEKLFAQLYGGIGVSFVTTKYNALDENGGIYDYSSINPGMSESEIKDALKDLRDGEYETTAEGYDQSGRGTPFFTPSLGLALGYWVSPTVAIGVSHKLTFPLNSKLDGQIREDNGIDMAPNDIHHYTSLGLTFKLNAGERTENNVDDDIIDEPVSQSPPDVLITIPSSSPHSTQSTTQYIEATVLNVSSKSGITFMVNGQSSNSFSYSSTTRTLTATINLQSGNNTVQIIASNSAGSASDQVTIIKEFQGPTVEPPVVQYTNPPSSPYMVNSKAFTVRANIINVGSESDILYFVNNIRNYDFSFNPTTQQFVSPVNLNLGNNTVKIQATNEAGTDVEMVTIIYEQTQKNSPVVNIALPASNPHYTNNNSVGITASVLNIDTKSQILFKINGSSSSAFDWNATTKIVTAVVPLSAGTTNVEIIATNTDGTASDATSIIYQAPVTPPTVNITSPYNDPHTANAQNITITASVSNVSSASNINFSANGVANNSFSFNPATSIFQANINLATGSNYIQITGSNSAGSDNDDITINYNPVQPRPSVNITVPSSNPYTTSANTVDLSAQTTNISSRSQITFKVNGVVDNGFSFNAGTGTITRNINLNFGTANVTISVDNGVGVASDAATLIHQQQPQIPPVVNITYPYNNPHATANGAIEVTASVANVSSAANISVKVNGNTRNDFTYNNSTTILRLDLSLTEGANNVVITATNSGGTASDNVTINYTAPTPPPTVDITTPGANPYTTNAFNVDLVAQTTNVNSRSQITFRVNGVVDNGFSFNASTGQISRSVNIASGTANVSITVNNGNGIASDAVTLIHRQQQVTPPTVNITSPYSNPHNTNSSAILLTASVANVSSASDVTVKVNGNTRTDFTFNPSTTILQLDLSLTEGSNNVVITATNTGGTASDNVTINYTAPIPPPTVNITYPYSSPHTSNSSAILVTASVTNVNSSSDITVKVNGVSTNIFTFNPSTTILQLDLSLVEGSNNVVITATNAGGTASDNVTINYSAPVPAPAVSITDPANTVTINSPTYTLKAIAVNVKAKSEVSIKLNGVNYPSFGFNTGSGAISAVVSLQTGNNMITVTATNSGGSSTASTSIIYIPKKAEKPEIEEPVEGNPIKENPIKETPGIKSPEEPVKVTPEKESLGKVGDKPLSPGKAPGKAATSVGSVQAPEVDITNPGISPTRVTTINYNVKATVKNVSSKNDITVTINGTLSYNFTYDAANNEIEVITLLDEGNNTVEVKATNDKGTTSDSVVIVRAN